MAADGCDAGKGSLCALLASEVVVVLRGCGGHVWCAWNWNWNWNWSVFLSFVSGDSLGVSIRQTRWEFVAGVGVGSEWSGLKSVLVGVDCWRCSGRIWQRRYPRYPWATISGSPKLAPKAKFQLLRKTPCPCSLAIERLHRGPRTASYEDTALPISPTKPAPTRLDMHERLPRRAPSCARARDDCCVFYGHHCHVSAT